MSPRVEQTVGEQDKSSPAEFGLININSHSNNQVHWTDWLEVVIIVLLCIGILRLIMKYWKKRSERRNRLIGTQVASIMSSNPPTAVHMTGLPMIPTARGPSVTRENLAITGPNITPNINEQQRPDYQAWNSN